MYKWAWSIKQRVMKTILTKLNYYNINNAYQLGAIWHFKQLWLMTADAVLLIELITGNPAKYIYWGEVIDRQIEERKGLSISYLWYLAVKSSLHLLADNETLQALVGWWTCSWFVCKNENFPIKCMNYTVHWPFSHV